MRAGLLTPQKVTLDFLIIPTNSQVLEPKPQPKISQNSFDTIQFPEILILKSLNKVLENDSVNGLDHFHSSLQRSQVNTDSPLNSLLSIPKPTPYTSYRELWSQIPTKLLEFQHIAWVTIAYLVGYDARVPDLLFYLEAIQGYNITESKLGCDNKFHLLDKNNT